MGFAEAGCHFDGDLPVVDSFSSYGWTETR